MPAFARSADFALDKAAGTPCPNLRADLRCGIHARLRADGFAGCAVFDCFGAGQRVTAVFGPSWREDTGAPPEALAPAFSAARQLAEALWHLLEARERLPAGEPAGRVADLVDRVESLLAAPAQLPDADAGDVRLEVGAALREASARLRRAGGAPAGRDLSGRDLSGRDLRRTDLRAADLRGTLLLGADLSGAVLRRTDLLGADLRGADLRGADLSDALFLTRPQLAAARGDAATELPAWLEAPPHWR